MEASLCQQFVLLSPTKQYNVIKGIQNEVHFNNHTSFIQQWKSFEFPLTLASDFKRFHLSRPPFFVVNRIDRSFQMHSPNHSKGWDIKFLVYLFRFLNKLSTKYDSYKCAVFVHHSNKTKIKICPNNWPKYGKQKSISYENAQLRDEKST